MKTTFNQIIFLFFIVVIFIGYSNEGISQNPAANVNTFAKRADISWLPQMEVTGSKVISVILAH